MASTPASMPARSSSSVEISGLRVLQIKVRRGVGLVLFPVLVGSYAAINPGLVLEAARWLVAAGVIAFAVVGIGASLLAGNDRFDLPEGAGPNLGERP